MMSTTTERLLADAVEGKHLAAQADRRVASMALSGVPMYVVAFFMVGFGTRFASEQAAWFWSLTIATAVVAVLRGWWIVAIDRLYDSPRRWRRGFAVLLILAGGLWGVASMLVVARDGLAWSSLLVLLLDGYFIGAAIFIYSHYRRLLFVYCMVILLPSAVALARLGDAGAMPLALAGLIYLVYIVVQSASNRRHQLDFLAQRRMLELNAEQLATARDDAEEASRAKTRFLAHMSHELRTPLTSIVGLSEQLEQPRISLGERKRTVAAMHDAADLLLSLIDDVLDLARWEDDTVSLRLAVFSPRAVVTSLVDLFQPRALDRQIALSGAVTTGTPEHVLGDSGRLRQVLINLIGNALKHASADAIHIQVSSERLLGDRAELRFAVSDTGTGIDAGMVERVFEPFTQGSAEPRDGAGLGLTICRRIVSAMGGSLEVETERGAGSVFTFVLPFMIVERENPVPEVAEEPSPQPPVEARDVPSTSAAGFDVASLDRVEESSMIEIEPHEGQRVELDVVQEALASLPPATEILVVEDNELNRNLFDQQLQILGHRAVVVDRGEAALDELENKRFTLILLDCMLPGIDGFETARRIRALEARLHRPRCPIVAVTAHAFREDHQACLDSGMDDWLTKPFRLHELQAKVDTWVPADVVEALG
ncbi:MAG: ATP-binding protein [Acidobacteriota bacterium]